MDYGVKKVRRRDVFERTVRGKERDIQIERRRKREREKRKRKMEGKQGSGVRDTVYHTFLCQYV